jgi:Zn-dependent protease
VSQLTPEVLAIGAAWFAVFLFSTTLHEAAHAATALKLGDPTAHEGGQVTLNPLPHIRREPIGMVVIPVISFLLAGFMVGWASAPYDPHWAHRHPKRSALMAIAGPLANLSLVVVAGIAVRIGLSQDAFVPGSMLVQVAGGGWLGGIATLLSILFVLNLILFVFNLLPLPPMDGSAVIQLFMSDDAARWLQSFYRQPMIGWVGIFVAWQFFGRLFRPVRDFAVSLLYAGLN